MTKTITEENPKADAWRFYKALGYRISESDEEDKIIMGVCNEIRKEAFRLFAEKSRSEMQDTSENPLTILQNILDKEGVEP